MGNLNSDEMDNMDYRLVQYTALAVLTVGVLTVLTVSVLTVFVLTVLTVLTVVVLTVMIVSVQEGLGEAEGGLQG